MAVDVTTIADDEIVVHVDGVAHVLGGLAPGSEHEVFGRTARTLRAPAGQLLARFATVNDVHFGEQVCGVIDGLDAGPVLQVGEGDDPYPLVMNRGAVADIRSAAPDAVIVKGDLTANGTPEEFASFEAMYRPVFGDRLTVVRGNHDAYHGQDVYTGDRLVDLPGVRILVLDTAWPGHAGGRLSTDQIDWVDTMAAESDRPVMVLGHHHAYDPRGEEHLGDYFGIQPEPSRWLVDVVVRRRSILGYWAGHTHRNRVRHFRPTGVVPWVEVACVKDFPGTWAEYRVYEGGVLQIHRRISTLDALGWSEQCRGLYSKVLDYGAYALGAMEDRCFTVPLR